MKKSFCLLLLFVPTFLFAGIKPKKIVLTPQVIYEGLADKKTPMGEGQMVVTASQTSGSGERECDIITGIFNDTCISNCKMQLSRGLVFEGDMSYQIEDGTILYYLKKGVFKGEQSVDISGLDRRPFLCPIDEPLVLRREFSQFLRFNPSTIQIPRKKTYTLQDDIAKIKYLGFPLSSLARFADNANSIEISDYDILGLAWGTYKSGTNSATINFKNGIVGHYSNQEDYIHRLSITKPNGDSLGVYFESKYSDKYRADVVHSFNKDFVEYHTTNEYSFSTNDDKVLRKLPSVLYNRYDSIRYSVKTEDRKKGQAHSDGNCFVNYYDGGSYYGQLYYNEKANYSTVKTEVMVAGMNNVPTKDDYYWGIYTAPDGSKELFVEGHTLEVLEKQYKEEKKKRDEQYRIAAQKAKKAEQEARQKEIEKRQPLYKKYGKQYVDALFDNNKILIGTPEGLIVNNLNSYLVRENQTTRVYEIKGVLGTWASTVYVNKTTKKVSSVTYRSY